METLGIRELKAQLSYHLRRAQNGARITIADRGKPIAVLGPAEPVANVAWAWKLVADGKATWNGGSGKRRVGLHPRIKAKGKPTSEMVIEDRR